MFTIKSKFRDLWVLLTRKDNSKINSPNNYRPNLLINYKSNFNDAIAFTKTKEFNLDSQCNTNPSEDTINQLINELSDLISKEIHKFKDNKIGEIANFGCQCGNVHFALIGFIQEHYKTLCANLTIGEIDAGGANKFKFNQTKCSEWLGGQIA